MDPDAVLTLIAEILRGTVPLPGAACDGRHELYDGRDSSGVDPENDAYQRRAAARVCAGCIHSPECPYAVTVATPAVGAA